MTEDRKPQSADKYIVRFPEGMRDRISEAAKANKRSMNAEIIARLEYTFKSDEGKASVAEMIRRTHRETTGKEQDGEVDLESAISDIAGTPFQTPTGEVRDAMMEIVLRRMLKELPNALQEALSKITVDPKKEP